MADRATSTDPAEVKVRPSSCVQTKVKSPGASARTVVPVPSGRNEFFTLTGSPRAIAGPISSGLSTRMPSAPNPSATRS